MGNYCTECKNTENEITTESSRYEPISYRYFTKSEA